MSSRSGRGAMHAVFEPDDQLMQSSFYDPQASVDSSSHAVKETRPDHYKVICISLYNDDLERLDGIVKLLKKKGITRANRSAVIRAALEQMDPARVRRGM